MPAPPQMTPSPTQEHPERDLPSSPDGDRSTVGVRRSRRDVVLVAGAGALAAAAAACAPQAPGPSAGGGPAPTTPQPPAAVGPARHLANRATFGATPAAVERIRSIGPAAWLDEQLAPWHLPDAESRLSGYTTLNQSVAQNEAVRKTDENLLFAELDHATLQRAVYSERQLYEVMCDFWSNHFNIWRRAKWLTQLKTTDDAQVVRPHALGRFADMLLASARSPAMLVYLDNYASTAEAGKQVNENYGRELLELHTLGIIDGAQVYTESDVVGVAKVLSGWSISWDNDATKYSYRFAPWAHSQEAVSLLGGAWTSPARVSWNDRVQKAEGDGVALLGFLARHPSTARHLSWKLTRRFVSDQPPMALVDRLAATYLANDTAIAPVLRELFLSPEFQASVGQKVKRPLDWLYSALRVTRSQIDPAPKGAASSRLRSAAQALGQPLFERVSPDGWPDRATYWVAADGLLKRWEHSAKLARNKITDADSPEKVVVDAAALVPSPTPATVREALTATAGTSLQFELSADAADAIAAALRLSPTAAGTALVTDQTLVQNAIGLLLSHPDFQRR